MDMSTLRCKNGCTYSPNQASLPNTDYTGSLVPLAMFPAPYPPGCRSISTVTWYSPSLSIILAYDTPKKKMLKTSLKSSTNNKNYPRIGVETGKLGSPLTGTMINTTLIYQCPATLPEYYNASFIPCLNILRITLTPVRHQHMAHRNNSQPLITLLPLSWKTPRESRRS